MAVDGRPPGLPVHMGVDATGALLTGWYMAFTTPSTSVNQHHRYSIITT